MSLKHMEEYRDTAIAKSLIKKIETASKRCVRLMEVCGTHTVSIFRSGIRTVLPPTISLLSGPGCPVCVTDQKEIDAFIELARMDGVIVTTFGDLMRVPGTHSSLLKERAGGRDIRIVYSTFDALEIARKNPSKRVVFLGVGFETTAPTIAAAIISAAETNVNNFSVISAHKLVPPALEALMATNNLQIDGLMLPGHVSVIIGERAYQRFFKQHRIACVITGFEPVDILQAIWLLVDQIENGRPALENAYRRAVTPEGNAKAQKLLGEVFEPADVSWRAMGIIAQSGLKIRRKYERYDAEAIFDIEVADSTDPKGCACGDILIGVKTPPQCPLFKTVCTPEDPVGPCMVSTEGTCAAYYKYHV